jgi:hypothetical protein
MQSAVACAVGYGKVQAGCGACLASAAIHGSCTLQHLHAAGCLLMTQVI